MRNKLLRLAPMALAMTIGCGSDEGLPTVEAPGGGPASVTAEGIPPRPVPSGKRTVAKPVKPISPTLSFD